MTADPLHAQFILAHGTEALGAGDGQPAQARSVESLLAALRECAARSPPPPMVVANPDVVTVHGAELRTMPGTLAAAYERMGGQVCGRVYKGLGLF